MRARRTRALSLGFAAAILVGAAPAQAQPGTAKTAVERALMAISTAERSRDPGAAAAAAAAARQARNLLRNSAPAAPMTTQKRSWPAAGRVMATADRPGVDIRTEPGALVLAPADGIVRFAGAVAGYNHVLILDQGQGYVSVLTGLESAFVGPGDRVGRAEPLGQVAKTPASARRRATALYFEVRADGAPVDPRRWLRGEDQSGAAIASKSPQSGGKVLSRAATAPVG